MDTRLVATLALALLVAVPAASAGAGTEGARLDCSGEPTGIPAVVFAYQLTCGLVAFACDLVFDPCPLD